MKLFNDDPQHNLLPYEGRVQYFGKIMDAEETEQYFKQLSTDIEWKNDEARIFGKHFITKRKVAWYGDSRFSYTYSNATKEALPWTKELLELKERVEQLTGTAFNSCLLNLYHNGSEGMAWHSDDEKSLGKDTTIASLSFGAERKFAFRHKQSKETISLTLEHGSLLIMAGSTQTHWLHRLPPTTKVHSPRINLTFRTMLQQA
ncbi:MAG TPA: alpha-ketoglutarate-dependent dioxygenase AlkB [Chitinophagaceae bacterium]|nr:alpha-ketoglutarate-dependent dioxygenase AlkB [Chitinophagaceae bacterium]